VKLKVGDKAPDFKGLIEDGSEVCLEDYQGKKLVLFFYPADNTPGCTKEVCSLRDGFSELEDKGYTLLGVSPDSLRKHQNFIKKYDLPFHLLVDQEKEVINAYGVWGPKKFMGMEFEGVLRTTFIINEKGEIAKIFEKVKTKSHADQILEFHP
jgi:peroxiredoxin Q/BCP